MADIMMMKAMCDHGCYNGYHEHTHVAANQLYMLLLLQNLLTKKTAFSVHGFDYRTDPASGKLTSWGYDVDVDERQWHIVAFFPSDDVQDNWGDLSSKLNTVLCQ